MVREGRRQRKVQPIGRPTILSFVFGTGLERNGMLTGIKLDAGPLIDVEPEIG